jgi:hypothetical protein
MDSFWKGKNASDIPVHHIFSKLGETFCRSHTLVPILFEQNMYQKSAIVADPVKSLPKFDEGACLTEDPINDDERYPVDVCQGVRTIRSKTEVSQTELP